MEVPYANLKRIYDNSKKELDKAVQDCIDNSWFIKGPKVLEFEDNLATYCKADAVGVSSGTSALLLAYDALNLKPGDKILKFLIAPCTDVDLVEYSNFSQSSIV